MSTEVRCYNQACSWFNDTKTTGTITGIYEGEKIYCGGCGYEVMIVGEDTITRLEAVSGPSISQIPPPMIDGRDVILNSLKEKE